METNSLHFGKIYRTSVTTLLFNGRPDKGGGTREKEQTCKSRIIMECFTGDIDLEPVVRGQCTASR